MLVVSEAFNCQRLECSDPSLVFLQMLKLRHRDLSKAEVLPTVSQNWVWQLLSSHYRWLSSVIMEIHGGYVWRGDRQGPGCGAGHCPAALGVLLFLGCGTSHREKPSQGSPQKGWRISIGEKYLESQTLWHGVNLLLLKQFESIFYDVSQTVLFPQAKDGFSCPNSHSMPDPEKDNHL